jgi:hypothetical protein
MIGVLCAPHERAVVEELFQLFKTPWCFADEGADSTALLVSEGAAPAELTAPTVMAFGGSRTWVDEELGLATGEARAGGELVGERWVIPIGGRLLPVAPGGPVVARLAGSGAELAAEAVAYPAGRLLRCGYDLLEEVRVLLVEGQPAMRSTSPTLDLHIELLRRWLVSACGSLVEIPPVRDGHPFGVCLSHDIDFLSIRSHWRDRTMLGLIARASLGSVRDLVTGRGTFRRLRRNWAALAKLPLVLGGRLPDLWSPFGSYERVDGTRATFYVIPFRNRGGGGLDPGQASRRATRYDATDVAATLRRLAGAGHEVAVHGIDAWRTVEAGRAELERLSAIVPGEALGVRMHWLMFDDGSPARLDEAGFAYDSTGGYNDAVGFKAGTSQAFRPPGATRLLELPLHLQDTALFFPRRQHLRLVEAWQQTTVLREAVRRFGGVLTVSWHDRSLAPERLWDEFYERLLAALRADGAWFGTAREIVDWFRLRREVSVTRVDHEEGSVRVHLDTGGRDVSGSGFVVRTHLLRDGRHETVDTPWTGAPLLEIARPRAVGAGSAG